MLEENNNIIIVDDNQEHIDRLSRVFCNNGIGCRTFLYDQFNMPSKPLENVKLAFFDICLATTGNDNEQFAILCDALKSYVSCSNKGFVLVFWTSKMDMISDFVGYVNEREKGDIPKPIAVKCIDKIDFLEREKDPVKSLSELFEDKLIKCLFSFDTELKKASDNSLNEVLKLIDFPDAWGKNEKYVANIKDVFGLIAVETFGRKRGKKEPDLAIKEAFGPLLLHNLCYYKSYVWQDFFDGKDIAKIKDFPNSEIVAKLNTIFHLDFSSIDEEARGSVRGILRNNSDTEELFLSQVGYKTSEWVDKILLKGKAYNGEIDEIIAIEISAACDYSNAKSRTHQYLLGIILQDDVYNSLDKNNLGDAIYELPLCFMYNEHICHMLIHFNYLLTEESKTIFKLLGKRLFSLKNEVMNMIGDRHARHISRIGITSFR